MPSPSALSRAIADVIRGELDDVDRYIKREEYARARRELDDAVTKLRKIADQVRRLQPRE